MLSTISGYEVFVVALAVAFLVIMAVTALLGVLTRLVRGRVEPEPPQPRRRTRRRRGRSPGAPS